MIRYGWLGMLAFLTACGGGSGGGTTDPLVEGYPIAYVKRSIPVDDQGVMTYPDIRDPIAFNPGAELFIRDHASSSAQETNLTSGVIGVLGDVKDVEVSYDGTRLLFAMRLPEIPNADPEDQPTWNIWEYNIPNQRLRRVIQIDAFAEEGHDVAPIYLPDGRIVFSSTRQHRSKEMLTDEGKPRYTSLVDGLPLVPNESLHAMMLHVMNADGTEFKQLTFSPKRDLDPVVLSNGQILFSRWERDRMGTDEVNLYTVKPDGSNLRLIYGSNSHDTGTDNSTIQFVQPREFHDGRLLTIARPYLDTFGGGDMMLIDTRYYVDNDRPNKDNLGIPGNAQESLSNGAVSTVPGPSSGGRYASVYPLNDGTNRSLVSWSQCRMLDGNNIVSCANQVIPQGAQEAPPFYGLFIHDHTKGTRLPIIPPREGTMITDVVVTQDRPYPALIEDSTASGTTGFLHIRSVYDFDGVFRPASVETVLTASIRKPDVACSDIPATNMAAIALDDRAPVNPMEMADYGRIENSGARFLRLVRPMITPERNDLDRNIPRFAQGGSVSRDGFVEIIGYAPIELDGSVKVEVPADIPFSFQILDRNGRRLEIPAAQDRRNTRHMNWLQVKAGETLECNGCHIRDSQVSHGSYNAVASVNTGASSSRAYECMEDAMVANVGETMAETRTRICETESCADVKPTLDLIYEDIWTKDISSLDSQVVFAKGNAISYLYSDVYNLTIDLAPVRRACTINWTPDCRVSIIYPDHIAPLWNQTGRTNNIGQPATCGQNGCHSPVAADGVTTQIPAPATGSQLNLSENELKDLIDNQDDEQNHMKSYRELMSADFIQFVFDAAGPLQDELFDTGDPLIDPMTQLPFDPPQFAQQRRRTVPGRPLSPNGANASVRFFNEMENDPGGTFDHRGALTPAELKLISEWLDNGGQYYSNPFDAPDPIP